jgi:hypothetical protein
MKKLYNLLLVLGLPAVFLVFTSGVMYHSGSPGGKTGSPGDNGANCTGCHAGTAINQELWIVSPELILSGYTSGQTYSVIVTGHNANASKFGFEATAEDNSGNKVGSFTADVFGFTQTINNNKAITHTSTGSVPLSDTATVWSFSWTAPATSTGPITFYVAVNTANGNGQNSGDQINLSQFSFSPSTVGVAENEKEDGFRVYPVPSSGVINITNGDYTAENRISIMNLSGQLVYQDELVSEYKKLDISHLEKGIYLVKIGTSTQRIILH